MGSWELRPGLHNVGSFQVSGKPFASGSCLAPAAGSATLKIEFPAVTKWVQIVPHSTDLGDLKVGFSKAGTVGTNFFTVNVSSSAATRLDLKVSELHFVSADSTTFKFDVIAGLTNIPPISVETEDGPSWQGTTGVG